MSTTTLFFLFIPVLVCILLAVNLVLAPHNPYQEKKSPFECGFHSFLGQNRTQFSISFFIFALLFLLFDLEILLIYPYSVSASTNEVYGLIIMLTFFLALTMGFIFEINKNALNIDSRQMFKIKKITNRILGVFASISGPYPFFYLPMRSIVSIPTKQSLIYGLKSGLLFIYGIFVFIVLIKLFILVLANYSLSLGFALQILFCIIPTIANILM